MDCPREAAAGHGDSPEAVTLAQKDRDHGGFEAGAGDKHIGHFAHRALGFTFRSDHKAGGVAEGQQGQIEIIAEL